MHTEKRTLLITSEIYLNNTAKQVKKQRSKNPFKCKKKPFKEVENC